MHKTRIYAVNNTHVWKLHRLLTGISKIKMPECSSMVRQPACEELYSHGHKVALAGLWMATDIPGVSPINVKIMWDLRSSGNLYGGRETFENQLVNTGTSYLPRPRPCTLLHDEVGVPTVTMAGGRFMFSGPALVVAVMVLLRCLHAPWIVSVVSQGSFVGWKRFSDVQVAVEWLRHEEM